MYKVTSTLLKVLEIILLVFFGIALIDDDISHATLFAILAFYNGYQADQMAKSMKR